MIEVSRLMFFIAKIMLNDRRKSQVAKNFPFLCYLIMFFKTQKCVLIKKEQSLMQKNQIRTSNFGHIYIFRSQIPLKNIRRPENCLVLEFVR